MKYKEYIVTYKVGEKIETDIIMGAYAKDAWDTFKKENTAVELLDIKEI